MRTPFGVVITISPSLVDKNRPSPDGHTSPQQPCKQNKTEEEHKRIARDLDETRGLPTRDFREKQRTLSRHCKTAQHFPSNHPWAGPLLSFLARSKQLPGTPFRGQVVLEYLLFLFHGDGTWGFDGRPAFGSSCAERSPHYRMNNARCSCSYQFFSFIHSSLFLLLFSFFFSFCSAGESYQAEAVHSICVIGQIINDIRLFLMGHMSSSSQLWK